MPVNNRPENATAYAMRSMTEFLSYCVRIGWPKSSLDDLEAIWWKYHDREGNLIC